MLTAEGTSHCVFHFVNPRVVCFCLFLNNDARNTKLIVLELTICLSTLFTALFVIFTLLNYCVLDNYLIHANFFLNYLILF